MAYELPKETGVRKVKFPFARTVKESPPLFFKTTAPDNPDIVPPIVLAVLTEAFVEDVILFNDAEIVIGLGVFVTVVKSPVEETDTAGFEEVQVTELETFAVELSE